MHKEIDSQKGQKVFRFSSPSHFVKVSQSIDQT